MKKLIFIIIVFCGFAANSQSFVEGDSLIIYGGGTFGAEVQGVEATDSASFVILGQISSFTGVDSMAFDTLTGDFSYYNSGILVGTENLDGRYAVGNLDNYVLYTDSNTIFITPTQLSDSLEVLQNQINNMTYVYTFTLPIAGTLAQSVALVSDLPDGWTLTASGTNLSIEHNLNRSLANVGVKYNQSGTIFRSLVPFQTAFNTFQDNDLNNSQIISISNYFTQYALKVHLTFD